MAYCLCPKNDWFAVKRHRSRVLAHFDVFMNLCLDLAQTWYVRVILEIKNIGKAFIFKKWLMSFKTQPFLLFGAFGHFHGKTKKKNVEQRDDDWEGVGWRNWQKNMMFFTRIWQSGGPMGKTHLAHQEWKERLCEKAKHDKLISVPCYYSCSFKF